MLRCLTFSKVSTNNKEGPAGLQDRVRTSGHIWEWRKETVTSDLVVADPSEHTQNLVGGWNKTTQRDHLFRRDVDLELILRGGKENLGRSLLSPAGSHLCFSVSAPEWSGETPVGLQRELQEGHEEVWPSHLRSTEAAGGTLCCSGEGTNTNCSLVLQEDPGCLIFDLWSGSGLNHRLVKLCQNVRRSWSWRLSRWR